MLGDVQKIGLVLSGGGGKGAYEVGVWRAMERLGLAKDIAAVSGTSVGALNAALFAQGDLTKAEESWLSMRPSDVLSIDLKGIVAALIKGGIIVSPAVMNVIKTLAMNGVFSRDGLHRIIKDYLDEATVKHRGVPCYVCATKLPLFKATYFSLQDYRQETIEDILLASSAIPFVFPKQVVQGEQYWDGFIRDNTPIKPLVEEGCNIIIAVMLSRSDLLPIDKYPDCKIIPIYPQEHPGGALSFNQSAEKMQRGYDDAMAVLAPVFELVEINYQYSVELLKYRKQHMDFESSVQDIESEKRRLEDAKTDLLKEMSKW
ncbi:patatin-like phospholipase family protein [Vibrio natriegens]|uniref:patatin-like phospholipase family protein n=1 Tax=Vibrio natriegens TaxID=691 RepID=UPI002284996A|nr:patatin-like phospholipase family protein [Vibrio natriegens]MCY9877651.1 patatin-like phospholipase family protein [Vibrio natriegens]